MRRVKVIWEKPIDIESAFSLNHEENDFGIYQLYGHHLVFGAGVTSVYRDDYRTDIWCAVQTALR